MTQTEINEGNKLIALFLNWEDDFAHITDRYGVHTVEGYYTPHINNKAHPANDNKNIFAIEELEFNSNWSWIMPVVEKISTIKFKFGRFSTKIVTLSRNPYCRMDSPAKSFRNSTYNDTTLKECIFKTVVEFIKYYNKENETIL